MCVFLYRKFLFQVRRNFCRSQSFLVFRGAITRFLINWFLIKTNVYIPRTCDMGHNTSKYWKLWYFIIILEAIKIREPKTCPSRILKSYVANISFRCLKIKGLSLNMLYWKYLFDIDFQVSLFAVVVVAGVK